LPSRRHASSEAPQISCPENPESTLSRSDGVDRIERTGTALTSSRPQCATAPFSPRFITTRGTYSARTRNAVFRVIAPREPACFGFLGQQNVDRLQNPHKIQIPAIFKIIIRVGRSGESSLFGEAKELGDFGAQRLLK